MKSFSAVRWQQIEALFDAALDLDDDARRALLDRACADEPDLRREVERLLQAEAASPAFLNMSAVDYAAPMLPEAPDMDEAGLQMGAYRLVREIGRGGMGRVFLAERADGQFEQQVALKLIHTGVASEPLRRRFLQERQILARLQHPGIARLIDGGTTGTGQPYLVMEYVAGKPIHTYSDAHRLSITARLRLFGKVCEAVQYAHQNLIVHRDLKPSNILVTDRGEVKLLDFGIAKLLESNAAEVLTRTGVPAMTPEYAAPEQVRGGAITTATDVYSLGVILYELLSGHRPYRIRSLSPADMERVICETAPPRPSTAATQTEERDALDEDAITPEAVSWARSTQPERLQRRLIGDLDMIVAKALAKEPDRRYATAAQLGQDLKRHLAGLPVEAQGDTLRYRLRKFVRRHQWGVAMAATFVLLLAGFGTLYTVQVTQERNRAQREAEKSARVTEYLLGLFEGSDPSVAQGDTITARELLARGVARADALADQPDVQATLLGTTGHIHFNLGNWDQAEVLLRRTLHIWEGVSDTDPEAINEAKLGLARTLELQNRLEESQELYRSLAEAPGTSGEGTTRARALYGLFTSLHALGEAEEADSVFRIWAATVEDAPPGADPRVAQGMVQLGQMLWFRGDTVKAETLLRRGAEVHRAIYGNRHPNLGNALNAFGTLLTYLPPSAITDSVTHEAVELHRLLFPDGHAQLSLSLSQRADYLQAHGRLTEAEALLREALGMEVPSEGQDGLAFMTRNRGLARVLIARGRFDEAESRLRDVRGWWEQNFGPDHPFTLSAYLDLADALVGQKAYPEAETLLLTAHEHFTTRRGNEDRYTQSTVKRLVALYEAWGRPAKATTYRALLITS